MTDTPLRLGASEFRSLHAGTGIVRATLERLEDWRRPAEGLRLLDAGMPDQSTAPDAAGELAGVLVDAVTAGRPVPDDVADRAHRLVKSAEADAALSRAFHAAREELTTQLDDALRRNWGTILRALNDELQDVVAQARGLSNLSQLHSAEAAIASDRADDYRAWRALVDRNASVRREQMIILRKSGIGIPGGHAEIPYLSKPEKVFKHWAAWRRDGALLDPESGLSEPLTPPWPARDPRGVLTVTDASAEEFLAWSVMAGAELWIPEARQMAAEADRLTQIAYPDATRLDPRAVR